MPSKKIGALSAELILEIEGFNKPLKDAAAQAKEFEKLLKPGIAAVEDLGKVMVVTGAAVTASMLAMVKASANVGEQLNKAAIQTGITTEQLSKLKFAAEQDEASFEALTIGLKKMSTEAVKTPQAFKDIGVSVRDASGSFRPMNDILLDVADVFKGMPDGVEKSALAVKLFGKSGTELIPVLNEGRDGLNKYGDEAERFNLVMGRDAAAASDAFNDNLKKIEDATLGLSNAVAQALLPQLTDLAVDLQDLIVDVTDFTKSHQGLTKALFDSGAALTGAGGLLLGLAGLGTALPKAIQGLQLFGITATAAQLGVVALGAAIGIGIGAFINYEIAGTKAESMLDKFTTAVVRTLPFMRTWGDTTESIKKGHDEEKAAIDQAIKGVTNLGIAYDGTKKSTSQILTETKNLVQQYYGVTAASKDQTASQDKVTTSIHLTAEEIKKQQEIEAKWRAANAEIYADEVKDAAKFVDAWLKGFEVTSAEADKYTDSVQRAQVKTSELAYTSVDAMAVIAGARYKAHDAWDDANGKDFNSSVELFDKIQGLNNDEYDEWVKTMDKRVKTESSAVDAQLKEQERYRDAFVQSIANLNTRIAESFADMIVHAKFNMDSLVSIAQDTASKMLSAFLSGLLSPLTSALANVGKSLGDTLFGAAGGTGGIGGIVGGLFGGGGATGTGIGGATSTALGAAGFTADAVIPGTGGLGAIGGLLTNPITLGIGAAVAGVVAWVKSQAHWEANDLVKNFQNPFDAQVAGLVSQIVNNQDALSSADVRGAYTQIHDLWQSTIDTVQNWAAGSSDRGTVASQFYETEVPVMQGIFDWLGSLDAGKRAVGLATGTNYVPYDNFPAMLHKGEAVVPAAQNPWAGGSSGLTVNINMESGAVFDEGIFRSKVLPMLELVLKNNTSGIAATTTLAVKRNWNSVVIA